MKEQFKAIIEKYLPGNIVLPDYEKDLLEKDRYKAGDIFYLLFDYNRAGDTTKILAVTNECLYLTNYEDLTMAAQFEDETIPSE